MYLKQSQAGCYCEVHNQSSNHFNVYDFRDSFKYVNKNISVNGGYQSMKS